MQSPKCLLASFVLAAALLPGSASALPVTYQFSGQVAVLTGTLGSTAVTVGMPVTLTFTVERSTPGIEPTIAGAIYGNAITDLSFAVGGTVGQGVPSSSLMYITNDASRLGPADDEIEWTAYGLPSSIAGTNEALVYFDFIDTDERALASTAISAGVDWTQFENQAITITFTDGSQNLNVGVNVSGIATPAPATSWGRIKADYR